MPMTQQEEQGATTFRFLQNLWNKPLRTVIVGIIAATAAIAKIVEFFVRPDIPDWIKVLIWIVLSLTAFLLVVEIVAWGITRLIENALERRMLQDEILAIAAREVTSEVAYTFDSKIYGMSNEDLIAHCAIRNDGSAIFRREIHIKAYSLTSTIDHYMLLPEASKKGEDLLEFISVESLTPFIDLTPEVTELVSGRLSLRLFISPPLGSGKNLRYQVTEEALPGLYAITGLEKRKMPFDYFSWDINYPTKKLEMKVLFPEAILPSEYGHDVWHALGKGRARNNLEYERVKDFLYQKIEGVYYTLMLDIPYPVLGLTYVVKWTPPRPVEGQVRGPWPIEE